MRLRILFDRIISFVYFCMYSLHSLFEIVYRPLGTGMTIMFVINMLILPELYRPSVDEETLIHSLEWARRRGTHEVELLDAHVTYGSPVAAARADLYASFWATSRPPGERWTLPGQSSLYTPFAGDSQLCIFSSHLKLLEIVDAKREAGLSASRGMILTGGQGIGEMTVFQVYLNKSNILQGRPRFCSYS